MDDYWLLIQCPSSWWLFLSFYFRYLFLFYRQSGRIPLMSGGWVDGCFSYCSPIYSLRFFHVLLLFFFLLTFHACYRLHSVRKRIWLCACYSVLTQRLLFAGISTRWACQNASIQPPFSIYSSTWSMGVDGCRWARSVSKVSYAWSSVPFLPLPQFLFLLSFHSLFNALVLHHKSMIQLICTMQTNQFF